MKLSYSDLIPHESVSDVTAGGYSKIFFIIVYPCGDGSRLSVAEAQDFDVPDYAMASSYYFDDESKAESYARHLARKNGLSVKGGGGLLD